MYVIQNTLTIAPDFFSPHIKSIPYKFLSNKRWLMEIFKEATVCCCFFVGDLDIITRAVHRSRKCMPAINIPRHKQKREAIIILNMSSHTSFMNGHVDESIANGVNDTK